MEQALETKIREVTWPGERRFEECSKRVMSFLTK